MPASWDSVVSNPQYQALPPEQREAARQQYFNDVVAPQAPADQLDAVKAQFDAYSAKPTLTTKVQPVSTGEDVAKSIGSGLVKGGASLAMMLPNTLNQAVAGPQLLGRGVAEGVDKLIGVQPQPRGELWKPFYGSEDVVKAAGLDYEPQTTAGKVADVPAQMAGGLIAAKGLQSGAPKLTDMIQKKPPVATPEERVAQAKIAYADAEQKGGVLQPKVSKDFLAKIKSLAPQTSQGQQLSGDSVFTQTANKLEQALKGQKISFQAADEIDGYINDQISATIRTDPSQARKLMQIKDAFRETIHNAPPIDVAGGKAGFDAWKAADEQWAIHTRLKDVERIIERAKLMDNPPTALKTGFRNLYLELKKNPRGFSQQEISAIKNAAESGLTTNVLRLAGSRLGPLMAGGAGFAAGGPAGAVAGFASDYMASGAARAGADKLQLNRAENALKVIANRKAPKINLSTPIPKNQAMFAPLINQPKNQ